MTKQDYFEQKLNTEEQQITFKNQIKDEISIVNLNYK